MRVEYLCVAREFDQGGQGGVMSLPGQIAIRGASCCVLTTRVVELRPALCVALPGEGAG